MIPSRELSHDADASKANCDWLYSVAKSASGGRPCEAAEMLELDVLVGYRVEFQVGLRRFHMSVPLRELRPERRQSVQTAIETDIGRVLMECDA